MVTFEVLMPAKSTLLDLPHTHKLILRKTKKTEQNTTNKHTKTKIHRMKEKHETEKNKQNLELSR